MNASSLPAQYKLKQARQQLGQIVHAATDNEINLMTFEVLVAFNLQYPQRSRQEYLWLDVLAAKPATALQAVRELISNANIEELEETGLLRPAGEHPKMAGHNPYIKSNFQNQIPVNWQIPVAQGTPFATIIRDPSNGQRVGFVGSERQHQETLTAAEQQSYVLVARKPVRSLPQMLCPMVWTAETCPEFLP